MKSVNSRALCTSDSMLLYAVTDRAWLGNNSLVEQVEEAIKGGATFIQLREKNLDKASFLEEAIRICEICNRYCVPFVINDNVQIAIECGADGVHVGQDDMAVKCARELMGKEKIIGVSAHTVEEAVIAEKSGADYLGLGAVFPSATKTDVGVMPNDVIKAVCEAVTIPVVGIGGINEENILSLHKSGLNGVAVVSAIFAKTDIYEASKRLRKLAERMVEH